MSGRSTGDDDRVAWTTIDFGPITAADYEQLTSDKPAAEDMTRGRRIAGALAVLRSDPGSGKAAFDPSSLSVARWHAEDDPGYVYVRIGLASAPAAVYEAAGLVHELEQSWTDWRIEDEWSSPRPDEVHVLQWHRGMDAPLARRGVRDEEGTVAFELGRAEYALVLQSFPDEPLVRDHVVNDYCHLDPALGEDLDSGLIKRLRLLAKVLGGGSALPRRGPAAEQASAQELPPLAENAATRWNADGRLDYIGTGPEPFSIPVEEADELILDVLVEAVDRGELDGALERGGATRGDALGALTSGDRAEQQRLFRVVVREVAFGEDAAAPIRLEWK